MPPKRNIPDDIEEFKKSIDFLTEGVSAVQKQQGTIMGLVEEVKDLWVENAEKDRKIVLLENRVADLEQYSRINDIIISGLNIKPRSYAHAASREKGEELTEQEAISVEGRVSAFFQSHGIKMDINNRGMPSPSSQTENRQTSRVHTVG